MFGGIPNMSGEICLREFRICRGKYVWENSEYVGRTILVMQLFRVVYHGISHLSITCIFFLRADSLS